MPKISLGNRISKRKKKEKNGKIVKKVNAERTILKNRPLKWTESKLTVGKITITNSKEHWERNNVKKRRKSFD